MKKRLFLMLSAILIASALCFCASAVSENGDMTEPDIAICGASIRPTSETLPQGLRFLTRANRTNDGITMVEEGTLIIPERLLSGELTLDTEKVLVIKKAAKRYYTYAENYYEYTGVLVNIPVNEYNTNIAARAYAKYTVGDDDTVYTAYSNTLTRSVLGVAEAVLADTSVDAEMKAAIQLIVDEYNAQNSQPSIGLEYDTNGDGTCCLIDMGECMDTKLIIPETSPDGDIVTSIDSSAFAGEAITSVKIPATIEEIGRKAFNGCDSLTDVYYEGSKEEWEILLDAIGSGNDALLDANIHFCRVTYYTVTFVDFDGEVLGTDVVASGEAATAPSDPERSGYTFTGWDKSFDNVTESITVTALYEKDEVTYDGPTIVVESVTASAGDTVEVELSIVNNPGIAGATVSIEYPVGVVFAEATNGDAFATLDFSHTNGLPNPCNLTWDSESGQTTANGTIANLKFTVPVDAKSGDTFEIKCSYKYGDIYNDSWDDVEIEFVNGLITVE